LASQDFAPLKKTGQLSFRFTLRLGFGFRFGHIATINK
jgi:hypothetical protein